MSGLIPRRPGGDDGITGVPEPRLGGVVTAAERLARWEVRAAQWRALELAQEVFGADVEGSLLGLRASGGIRGLMRLQVPFHTLDDHRSREGRFLALVGADPVMARVPLVFVVGPGDAS